MRPLGPVLTREEFERRALLVDICFSVIVFGAVVVALAWGGS